MTTVIPSGTQATWRNRDHDELIIISGILGEQNGVRFYSVQGSNTGIPEHEIYLNGHSANGHSQTSINALVEKSQPTPGAMTRTQLDIMPALPKHAQLDPSISASAAPWLDEYIKYSRRWSPCAYDNYHEAVGLWVLSTIAARRIAFPQGKMRYTSLYIALLGRTSVWTKTTAAEIGIATIRAAGLSYLLAPDEMTPQAFIEYLSDRNIPRSWAELLPEKQKHHKARLGFVAQKGWFYDEFGQKVAGMMRDGGHMAEYRGLLRRFDDGEDQYEYRSVSRGTDIVERPYLALLANMTPADLLPYAGRGAPLWNDGFWARFALVAPAEDTPRMRGRFPEERREIPITLLAPLMKWHERLGQPEVNILEDEENGKLYAEVQPVDPTTLTFAPGVYDAFYTYRDALLDLVSSIDQTDLDGNYSRLPEKAMRIAALFASLQGCEHIEMRHWARAQQVTERWRTDLHNLYRQLTTNVEHTKKKTREEAVCLLLAKKDEPLTKREIVQGVRGLSSAEAEEVLPAMVATGFLVEVTNGTASRYTLAG